MLIPEPNEPALGRSEVAPTSVHRGQFAGIRSPVEAPQPSRRSVRRIEDQAACVASRKWTETVQPCRLLVASWIEEGPVGHDEVEFERHLVDRAAQEALGEGIRQKLPASARVAGGARRIGFLAEGRVAGDAASHR